MNNRFTLKSVFSLIVILLTGLVLVACGEESDQVYVDAALDSVAVTYSTSDMATSVTQNLTLPALSGDITIAWTSSNLAVISNAGVVTRPLAGEDNVTVTLTAALSKGSATGTKTFTLTVIALPIVITDQDRVDDAVSTLGVTLAASDTLAAVTQHVTLAMMSGTVTVSWASNNAAVISNAGAVTRPAAGQADVTVLLTATLTLNDVTETKVFTLIVKALPYTALDALDMIAIEGTTVVDSGLVDGVQSYTTASNVVLPTSVLGFDVTWSTTNAAALSTTGVVVRPAYGLTNSTVILTATVLEEELTFTITVLAETEEPDDGLIELTLEQLAQFDGRNGNKAYIAVNGIIYDVTNSSLWPNGNHNGYQAGQDLTVPIMSSPHGLSTLSRLPIIGTLVGSTT